MSVKPKTMTQRIKISRQMRRYLSSYDYYISPAKYNWVADNGGTTDPRTPEEAARNRALYLHAAKKQLDLLFRLEGIEP